MRSPADWRIAVLAQLVASEEKAGYLSLVSSACHALVVALASRAADYCISEVDSVSAGALSGTSDWMSLHWLGYSDMILH